MAEGGRGIPCRNSVWERPKTTALAPRSRRRGIPGGGESCRGEPCRGEPAWPVASMENDGGIRPLRRAAPAIGPSGLSRARAGRPASAPGGPADHLRVEHVAARDAPALQPCPPMGACDGPTRHRPLQRRFTNREPSHSLRRGRSGRAPIARTCRARSVRKLPHSGTQTLLAPRRAHSVGGNRNSDHQCAVKRRASPALLTTLDLLRVLAPVNCSLRTDSQNMQSQIY